jgi:hypothetical protein
MPYMQPPASVTTWNRIEPRPRSNGVGLNLAAEVRDPAWFLARQWQVGEFTGQDAGSPAYVAVTRSTGQLTNVTAGSTTTAHQAGVPLETQAMAEPFPADDLTLQVEIGQVLGDLLDEGLGAGTEPATRIKAAFLAGFRVVATPEALNLDFFNPIDQRARRFLVVCGGKAIDGCAVYLPAKALPAGTTGANLPASLKLGASATENDKIATALGKLVAWVDLVWRGVGTADPVGWQPKKLDYSVSVLAAAPGGGTVTMPVVPDAEGQIQWSSLDVSAATTGTGPAGTTSVAYPIQVRFPGMPAQRFWDFESGHMAFPDVQPEPRDVTKLLVVDFMLVHGSDWFLTTLPQAVGELTRVDALVVTDVFGRRTAVDRADKGNTAPTLSRWTAFSNTRTATPVGVSDFLVLPPSVGGALQGSRVLEEVRFARDEMANMAWGIERQSPNLVGGLRGGSHRDAVIESLAPVTPPASTDQTSPLRYLLESRVPVQYVPLVPVPITPGSPPIELERAAGLRPNAAGAPVPVLPAGKILRPTPPVTPYRISEEEIPRMGTTVERVVYRARWIDGSTHLWVARRRRSGAGEAQSGLRFDAALPTDAQGT